MKSLVIGSSLLLLGTSAWAESTNPADMPLEAQQRMYEIISEYNHCMTRNMAGEQSAEKSGQDYANEILQQCEAHLEGLKSHLAANNVADNLAAGMSNAFRARAARQLMTQTMNSMAAQQSMAAEIGGSQ